MSDTGPTATPTTAPTTDSTGFARPRRQVLIGLGMIVVSAVIAVLLVNGEATTLAGVFFALIVAGVVLIGQGARLAHAHATRAAPTESHRDRTAVVALVLAVVLPPLGVLVGISEPRGRGRTQTLATAAVVIGTLMTLALTGLFIGLAASART